MNRKNITTGILIAIVIGLIGVSLNTYFSINRAANETRDRIRQIQGE